MGKRRLNEIGTRKIDGLKAGMLKKELSPKTVNNALGCLSKLLNYARKLEIISDLPEIGKLKCPESKFDFLSLEEAEQLLEAAKLYNEEWYTMIFVALRTGLRYGELCELRWQDVDFYNSKLLIRRSYCRGHVTTPKNGKEREIPLSPATVTLLKRFRHLKGELVFSKPDGGRHIHRRADVALKRACKKAKLRLIGWHILRHTFASHLVIRGRSLKEVQELLGHADYKQTLRYAHLCPTVRAKAVATLDQPIPPSLRKPDANNEVLMREAK